MKRNIVAALLTLAYMAVPALIVFYACQFPSIGGPFLTVFIPLGTIARLILLKRALDREAKL